MSEQIEGRNAVLEAFRSGRCVDKLFILDGCQDGPVRTIAREARKKDTIINYVSKERLDQLSETRAHQGVIAQVAAYEYSTVEEILEKAEEKGEPPFLVLLDNVEDPHNLGAIIRTANLAGAHGVIIPKRRSVGLTSTVAKTSAGALNYTPVAKVTNLVRTIEELKEKGIWFVCADMGGESMYRLNLTGPIGMIVGNEGEGVSRLVREACDFTASIPMKGDIDSLNAENDPELLREINPSRLADCLEMIAEMIEELPEEEELFHLMELAGCKKSVYEIGLTDEIVPVSLRLAPYVRRRLSFLRVSRLLDVKGE